MDLTTLRTAIEENQFTGDEPTKSSPTAHNRVMLDAIAQATTSRFLSSQFPRRS